jgi:hypothetical protein
MSVWLPVLKQADENVLPPCVHGVFLVPCRSTNLSALSAASLCIDGSMC